MTVQDYVIAAVMNYETEIPYVKEPELKYNTPLFKFVDLFAGIGGMRLAFESAGGQCVFTSEYDRFCQETYLNNFGEIPEGDITKISEKIIPDHDILIAGFPCQPFSIAGVSKKNSLGRAHGFLDKTQGTLFFDVVRILKEKRPKTFMLENVKNLTTHDKGRTFKIIYETLDCLGYKVFYKVLDGKYYVPQHRERILLIGFDKMIYGEDDDLFSFPEPPENPQKLINILEKNVDLVKYLKDAGQT